MRNILSVMLTLSLLSMTGCTVVCLSKIDSNARLDNAYKSYAPETGRDSLAEGGEFAPGGGTVTPELSLPLVP